MFEAVPVVGANKKSIHLTQLMMEKDENSGVFESKRICGGGKRYCVLCSNDEGHILDDGVRLTVT